MPAVDVIVIGGGIAGLSVALACADRGLRVMILSADHAGAASAASAGVLGPSIGRGPKSGRVGSFMFAARDRYPAFLEGLEQRTGIPVPTVAGAIEVALNETHFAELRARSAKLGESRVIDADAVAALEPALLPVAGAVLHPRDGAVDVAALMIAMAGAIASHERIAMREATVLAIDCKASQTPTVTLRDGSTQSAAHVVIAVGAWVGDIRGLPRIIPVSPIKGEIAAIRPAHAVARVIFGAGGYLVPRDGALLVGATSFDSGLDARITSAAAFELFETGKALMRDWPASPDAFNARRAGLRPMTPDGYPILGRDPDVPSLLYACGYSRNGVLLAPLAAECTAALIVGDDPGFDLSAFSAARFAG